MLAAALCLVGVAAFALLRREIADERRAVIERRLLGAAEILAQPARDVLTGTGSRAGFLDRLRDLGSVTGLRFTLIGANGDALADSEVGGPMPNLGDRPEVHAASVAGFASAARKSALTGKETVYVAHSIESDGKRIGTIRAATDTSELDTVLSGIEWLFALVGIAALGLGAIVGAALRRRDPDDVGGDEPVECAAAADVRIGPATRVADAPSLVSPGATSGEAAVDEAHAVARER